MTGIKRTNLIFYDKIGLLRPEFRGENGYRFYTYRQLSSAYLISDLRSIGVSIEEIKQYAHNRTPAKMIELFSKKEEDIEKEIAKLREIQGVMQLYVDLVKETEDYDIDEIVIREIPERNIFMGPILNCETEKNYVEASYDFYEEAARNHKDLNYPFGIIISKDRLLKDEYKKITCCYFLLPSQGNALQPAGRYVVGHMRSQFGEPFPLYVKLLTYIKENHLRICGNAYEEYPFNEMTHENEYLTRIMIQIE